MGLYHSDLPNKDLKHRPLPYRFVNKRDLYGPLPYSFAEKGSEAWAPVLEVTYCGVIMGLQGCWVRGSYQGTMGSTLENGLDFG